jgi:type III pantothenate kinase
LAVRRVPAFPSGTDYQAYELARRARNLIDRFSRSIMLLAIDVGNTQTVFGLFDDTRLSDQFRVGTDPSHTADELAVMLRAFVELDALGGIVLSTTVPQLQREYELFAERWAGAQLLVLGPGIPTGMPIRYDDPREVGPDRIANAVAARERHGAPAIVVDFGTSTNFDVVSAAGEYVGGVLAPGIEISMDALFARAARLTKVPFTAPERVIGKTTTAALQSGLVYGFAGQVDAIATRIREELEAPDAPVIATGGLAELIAPHSRTITTLDPELTLQGLRLVWEKNRSRVPAE